MVEATSIENTLSLYLKSWFSVGLSSVLVSTSALDQVLVKYWFWPLERRPVPVPVPDSPGPGY